MKSGGRTLIIYACTMPWHCTLDKKGVPINMKVLSIVRIVNQIKHK